MHKPFWWMPVKMPTLPFSCRWVYQLGRLLFGGVRFDEGGDPVVQFVDAIVSSTSGTSKVRVKRSKRNFYIPGAAASSGAAVSPRTNLAQRVRCRAGADLEPPRAPFGQLSRFDQAGAVSEADAHLRPLTARPACDTHRTGRHHPGTASRRDRPSPGRRGHDLPTGKCRDDGLVR
jgi:hypothetical protein